MPAIKPIRLTPHFLLSELACRDGTPVPEKYMRNAIAICERAEVLRAALGTPLFVTSGYRTASHNRRVGGATRSMHLTASALDLACRKMTGWELYYLCLKLIDDGSLPDGGLGRYASWVHIDIGRPRRWGNKERL